MDVSSGAEACFQRCLGKSGHVLWLWDCGAAQEVLGEGPMQVDKQGALTGMGWYFSISTTGPYAVTTALA